MRKRSLAVVLSLAAAACGRAQIDSAALPTAATLALDLPAGGGQAVGGGGGPSCHPHLFERTFLAVDFFNGLTGAVFLGIGAVIDTTKPTCTGKSCTWTLDGNDGFTYDVAVSPSGSAFDYTVGVAPKAASAPPTQVVVGSVTPTDGLPHTGKGTMTFDFDALASIDPAFKSAGKMTVAFDVSGPNKVLDFTLTNFTPDSASPFFPAGGGHYVFARTQDVGGSFKFQQSVDLWCPVNAQNSQATLQTVAVWSSIDGTFYGRADSIATGGQIPAGEAWVGLTCANLTASTSTTPDELYWLMKDEDGSGNSVAPSPYCANLTGQGGEDAFGAACTVPAPGPTTCQSIFGPLPDAQDGKNDYAFAKVNFDDSSVVPYPGEPDGGATDGG